MFKKILQTLLLLGALAGAAPLFAQQNYNFDVGGLDFSSGAAVPGSCAREGSKFWLNTGGVGWYTCKAGTWIIDGSGAGGGTVTNIATGTGLTGGPCTTTCTIALANTAVTPGAYTNANITIDAQGRITLAANGSGSGVTLQTNGVSNTSQTTFNLQNAAAFNGLTLSFSNPSAGNVTGTFSGTLGNAGLTNSTITINGTANQITAPGSTALGGTATLALANPLTTPGAVTINGTLTTNVTGGGTVCLQASNTGVVSGTGSACGSGGSTAFSALTAGTNTTAAMVVGTGSTLTTSGSGSINGAHNPYILGPATAGSSPWCFVDGIVNANINACISLFNTIGVTGTGSIYSTVPEEITTQIFTAASPRFTGTIYLNNDLGIASVGTCAQVAPFNCWIVDLPLLLPARVSIRGVGAAGQNSSGSVNSGTGISFGSTFPVGIGSLVAAGATIGSPSCSTTAGTLAAGNYKLDATLINNYAGGTNSPKSPGRGITSAESSVNCDGTHAITWTFTNAPAKATGATTYGAQEIAVYLSPVSAGTPLTNTEVEAVTVSCTGAAGVGAGVVDIDGGSCLLPTASGTVTFTITAVGTGGPPPPCCGVDLSNPMLVQGNGPDTGVAVGSDLQYLALMGSPRNTSLSEVNEPSCGILGYTGQEQSGTQHVTVTGAFKYCGVYSGFNSNNSAHIGLNNGSGEGPINGTYYGLILDGRMPSGGTARTVIDATLAGHCVSCNVAFTLTQASSSAGSTTYTGTGSNITNGGSNGLVGLGITVTGFAVGTNNVVNQTVTSSTTNTLVVATTTQSGTEVHAGTATEVINMVTPAQIYVAGVKAFPVISGVHTESKGGNGIIVDLQGSAHIFGYDGNSGGQPVVNITSTASRTQLTVHDNTGSAKTLVQDDSIVAGTGNCNSNNSYCYVGTAYDDLDYRNGLTQMVNLRTFQINDMSQGLPVLKFFGAAAATDWVQITNGTTASPIVTVEAAGGDTNVSLNLKTKGSGTITCNGAACVFGSSWSSLTAPSGNLSLTMASNTSTFNTTTALNQFFAFKNTTAAVVGTSQGSPVISLCGRAFHTSADVEDCMTLSELPGNGNDAAITFAIGHTGTSTGIVTTQFPGPVASGAAGGVGGTLILPEGTTASGAAAQDICYGDSTLHGIKCNYNNGGFLNLPLETGAMTSGDVLQVNATTNLLSDGGFLVSNIVRKDTSNTGGVNFTLNASASTSVGSISLPAVTGGTQLSGTVTAAASAPVVFQNTNSSNNNASVAFAINSPGTSTGQVAENINAASTSAALIEFGTGGAWSAGGLSGQTVVADILPTGVYLAKGATAGFIALTQGTTSAAVNNCNAANTHCIQAPTAVTASVETDAPAQAQGIPTRTGVAATIQDGYSGDANHSTTVTIGSATSIGSTSLCSTAICLVGTYRVNAYVDITTACGTSGTYLVSLIYTDDQGSKTVPINLTGTGSVPATGVLTTTSTANFGYDSFILRSTGAASINYSTTAVACGTGGPMVGKLYLSVEPVQ